jgi:hypothetical protein
MVIIIAFIRRPSCKGGVVISRLAIVARALEVLVQLRKRERIVVCMAVWIANSGEEGVQTSTNRCTIGIIKIGTKRPHVVLVWQIFHPIEIAYLTPVAVFSCISASACNAIHCNLHSIFMLFVLVFPTSQVVPVRVAINFVNDNYF